MIKELDKILVPANGQAAPGGQFVEGLVDGVILLFCPGKIYKELPHPEQLITGNLKGELTGRSSCPRHQEAARKQGDMRV